MLSFYSTMIDSDSEKSKFEIIYNLYKKRMWYVANEILQDPLEAEDAVHDAFIGIAKNISHIDDPHSKATFAYVITAARHAALNIANRNRDRYFLKLDDYRNFPDEEAFRNLQETETKTIIISALKEIPEIYRDLLYFRYVEEMSEKEIATLTGINYVTVRQRLSRARKMLLKLLEKEDEAFATV